MDAAVNGNAVTRPLELLGISAIEERAYHCLLEHHAATASKVAECIGATLRVTRRLLADLEIQGLATHTPKVPRVYVAAPPEFALAALIKQRQAVLERVRVAIPELEAQSTRSNAAGADDPTLELVSSRVQLGVVLGQMYASFRSEAMCFQRAPTLAPGVTPPAALRDGTRVRTISDNSLLEVPGTLARIQRAVAGGEEARTLASLPFKMMIFDRRVAVVTLDSDRPERLPTLLVHGNALLEALCLLFEFVWERATPLAFGHAEKLQCSNGKAGASAVADALIPLLAAGLNDKAIAAELGISSATLNRRMGELMRSTGTRSRFQLGWHAALEVAKRRSGASASVD